MVLLNEYFQTGFIKSSKEELCFLPAVSGQFWLKKGGYVLHFGFAEMQNISHFQGLRWLKPSSGFMQQHH